MIVQEPIQVIIWDCLNNYEFDNAIFLAERLHAEVCSEETAFLLGTCYYRAGRIQETHYLFQDIPVTLPQAKFLFAKCALHLKRYREVENILGSIDIIPSEFGEQAPYALLLLGRVYNSTERRNKAADAYKRALSLNPFMWEAFVQLCNIGEKVEPYQMFQMNNPDFSFGVTTLVNLVSNSENISFVSSNVPNAGGALNFTPSNVRTPTAMTITPEITAPVKRSHSVLSGIAPISFSPSFGMFPMDDTPPVLYTPTLTDSNEQKAIPKIVNSLRAQMGQLKDAVFPTPRLTLGPAPRRSSRLFSNNSSYSVKENNKSPGRKFATPKSPSRKSKQRATKNSVTKSANGVDVAERGRSVEPAPNNGAQQKGSVCAALLNLMRDLGEAYRALAFYDCNAAIKLFRDVSSKQQSSAWVQIQIARAHYELAQYEAAARVFADVRRRHPARFEAMDVYSTCLWHLQREVPLSALAQELVELDRAHPVAWLVAGNCFSLNKERDAALKFFKRAIQLDPGSAYAHALLGHEYSVAEETEKALGCFRSAIAIEPRNYVALFGMASVYARQERWKASELHVRRALGVHPRSGVLLCQLGVAQAALGRPERALNTLERAVSADGANPLCRFHRASVLLRLGRAADALADLAALKDAAPREALVYYLLGKVHSKLGNADLALMHYSWAADLDPKGSGGHIKDGFDHNKRDDSPDRSA